MSNSASVPSFENYWKAVQPRFIATARREWEALAGGPFRGTLKISLDEGCTLNIPLSVEVDGLSKEAVAHKLKAFLASSTLVSSDAHDAAQWQVLQKKAQYRLSLGDYDFSEGAIVCVDIAIFAKPS